MKRNFNDENLKELKQAFGLFSDSKGKIKPSDLKQVMLSIEFDKKNPSIFKIIEELDYEQTKDGITFDAFVRHVNDCLGNTNSKEGIEKIFRQLVDNPNDKYLSLATLKRIVKDFGENIDPEELKEMFLKVSNGSSEINFDEFYSILSRK